MKYPPLNKPGVSKHSYLLCMLMIVLYLFPSWGFTQTSQEVLDETDDSLSLPAYPPLDTFDQISQRPLFHASRRPKPKVDLVNEESQGDLMEKWRLVGVALTVETPLALLSERNGDKKLKLSVGMPLDQRWVVTEIGDDFVVLDGGDEQAKLELWQPRGTSRPGDGRRKKLEERALKETNKAKKTIRQREKKIQDRMARPANISTKGG